VEQETPRRRRRLSAEDKWQTFIEASAKGAKVADVLRRERIDPMRSPLSSPTFPAASRSRVIATARSRGQGGAPDWKNGVPVFG
jgi:hypothetical protein